MPSKKKKYNARFPPARIKKIMQTDEDVGKVAAAVPVIISRALELFIETLILKSAENTKTRNAKTLSAAHIKQTISSEKKFDFLKDLVANVPDVQTVDEDHLVGGELKQEELGAAPSAPPQPSEAPVKPSQAPVAVRPTPQKSVSVSGDTPRKRGRPRKIKEGGEEEGKVKTPRKRQKKKQMMDVSDEEGSEKTESDQEMDLGTAENTQEMLPFTTTTGDTPAADNSVSMYPYSYASSSSAVSAATGSAATMPQQHHQQQLYQQLSSQGVLTSPPQQSYPQQQQQLLNKGEQQQLENSDYHTQNLPQQPSIPAVISQPQHHSAQQEPQQLQNSDDHTQNLPQQSSPSPAAVIIQPQQHSAQQQQPQQLQNSGYHTQNLPPQSSPSPAAVIIQPQQHSAQQQQPQQPQQLQNSDYHTQNLPQQSSPSPAAVIIQPQQHSAQQQQPQQLQNSDYHTQNLPQQSSPSPAAVIIQPQQHSAQQQQPQQLQNSDYHTQNLPQQSSPSTTAVISQPQHHSEQQQKLQQKENNDYHIQNLHQQPSPTAVIRQQPHHSVVLQNQNPPTNATLFPSGNLTQGSSHLNVKTEYPTVLPSNPQYNTNNHQLPQQSSLSSSGIGTTLLSPISRNNTTLLSPLSRNNTALLSPVSGNNTTSLSQTSGGNFTLVSPLSGNNTTSSRRLSEDNTTLSKSVIGRETISRNEDNATTSSVTAQVYNKGNVNNKLTSAHQPGINSTAVDQKSQLNVNIQSHEAQQQQQQHQIYSPAKYMAENRGPIYHGPINYGPINHGPMNHGPINHGPMNHGLMNHGPINYGQINHGGIPMSENNVKHEDGGVSVGIPPYVPHHHVNKKILTSPEIQGVKKDNSTTDHSDLSVKNESTYDPNLQVKKEEVKVENHVKKMEYVNQNIPVSIYKHENDLRLNVDSGLGNNMLNADVKPVFHPSDPTYIGDKPAVTKKHTDKDSRIKNSSTSKDISSDRNLSINPAYNCGDNIHAVTKKTSNVPWSPTRAGVLDLSVPKKETSKSFTELTPMITSSLKYTEGNIKDRYSSSNISSNSYYGNKLSGEDNFVGSNQKINNNIPVSQPLVKNRNPVSPISAENGSGYSQMIADVLKTTGVGQMPPQAMMPFPPTLMGLSPYGPPPMGFSPYGPMMHSPFGAPAGHNQNFGVAQGGMHPSAYNPVAAAAAAHHTAAAMAASGYYLPFPPPPSAAHVPLGGGACTGLPHHHNMAVSSATSPSSVQLHSSPHKTS